MDFLEYTTVLKKIAFILNSRPVGLLLGAYKLDGGAQEVDSALSETWTVITPNDMLIGEGKTGNQYINKNPDSSPRKFAHLDEKF